MTPATVGSALLNTAWPFLLGMASPQQGAQGLVSTLIPMVLILGIFYFVMVLPMRKRQQKVQAFLQALKAGDRVITTGGVVGKITEVRETSFLIRSAEKTILEIARTAVAGVDSEEKK